MHRDEQNRLPLEPPEPFDPVPQTLQSETVSEPSLADTARPDSGYLAAMQPPIPDDLRTPWDWIDLVIFALLTLGGAFVVTVGMVMVFGLVLHIGAAQLRSSNAAKTYFAVANQAVLSTVMLGYIAAQIKARAEAPFWRTLGWRRLESKGVGRPIAYLGLIAGGFLLSMLVEILSGAFQPKAKMPIETFFQDRKSALVLMLMSVLLAPIFEETIFRGYIYPAVARRLGIAASIAITGTLFGLLHAPQLWGGWAQIALLILVGVIFTYARAKTGTVVASYLLHLSYNSFLFFGFVIGSHWLRAMPPGN
jgi:membrane protease YdiL (CAAX protease family)